MARRVTWTTIRRNEEGGWLGFMRITGALEPILCKAATKDKVEEMLVDWLARRGIALPDAWSYVETEGHHDRTEG